MRSRCLLCLICVLIVTCACAPDPESSIPDASQPVVTSASPTATSPPAVAPERSPSKVVEGERLQPEDFHYLGAFRLPGGEDRPQTFAYGGAGMTYRPDGDPDGPTDGFPGSLFLMGHDRMPYGEVPNGNQVAEVSIPVPTRAESPEALAQAAFLQDFHDVARGAFVGLDELPRAGLLYLAAAPMGPVVHVAWGAHFQPDTPTPTHGWFGTDLGAARVEGQWSLAGLSPYSVNGYLFEIPADWAVRYAQGKVIGAGRFRDGGWSGMGPTLVAYRPWDEGERVARAGAALEPTVLLRYASSDETDAIERCLEGYQHPDEWEGAAWLTTASGKSALLLAGTKAIGDKYWYGYVAPESPERPCVDTDMVGQFPVCRHADGHPCAEADLRGCARHGEARGWWSSAFVARFLLYDPADLARVASGEMASWEPQPYAYIDIDEHLLHNPDGVELEMLGSGAQRRYRVGEAAFDRQRGLLYVLELFADGAKPVVHVWQVG